jgi:hypothetical protein
MPPPPTAYDVLKTIQMDFQQYTRFGDVEMTQTGATFIYQGHRYYLTCRREKI